MSVDLDRQMREYGRHMDEHQGSLSFQDVLDRAEGMQVIPSPADRQPSPRRRWTAGAAALVVLIILTAVWLLPGNDQAPDPVDQPTPTVAPVRSDFPESGPIEAGTYRIEPSVSTVASVTLTLPDGWEAQDGLPYALSDSGPDAEAFFYFVTVSEISSEPCVGPSGLAVGPSVDDLVSALLGQPLTETSGPIDTTLGGIPAKRIDMTVPDDVDTAGCNVPGGLQIWYRGLADNYFVLLEDGTASVYILDINGERQVFLTQVRAGTSTEDIAELQAIVDSITFDE
jgi:hypothetical protein